MSADIWEPSPTEVREWLIVLLDSGADVEVQIRLDSKLLVCRAREIVAEAASAANPCLLRTNSHGSANSSEYGQVPGNSGMNCGVFFPSLLWQDVPTPLSPDDSSTEIPRRPILPIMLQTLMAYFSKTICSSSP